MTTEDRANNILKTTPEIREAMLNLFKDLTIGLEDEEIKQQIEDKFKVHGKDILEVIKQINENAYEIGRDN